jgi:hypothetical protein
MTVFQIHKKQGTNHSGLCILKCCHDIQVSVSQYTINRSTCLHFKWLKFILSIIHTQISTASKVLQLQVVVTIWSSYIQINCLNNIHRESYPHYKTLTFYSFNKAGFTNIHQYNTDFRNYPTQI